MKKRETHRGWALQKKNRSKRMNQRPQELPSWMRELHKASPYHLKVNKSKNQPRDLKETNE